MRFQGLRFAALAGAIGTTLGSWIKVFSVSPDRFWITFFGQSLVALSQTFILSVPARLAAVWFGPDQVSSACSIGVFGNQVSFHSLRKFFSPQPCIGCLHCAFRKIKIEWTRVLRWKKSESSLKGKMKMCKCTGRFKLVLQLSSPRFISRNIRRNSYFNFSKLNNLVALLAF